MRDQPPARQEQLVALTGIANNRDTLTRRNVIPWTKLGGFKQNLFDLEEIDQGLDVSNEIVTATHGQVPGSYPSTQVARGTISGGCPLA